ncbi:MAG: fructose-6-phosphate aldolase [Clostridiales bacterium]|nr:fructose-6-phosphate aldolase [Clostridiales bacterium]
MKLLIDDANIVKVKETWEYYPCDGVTTNPSILAASERQPYEVLREIREFIGPERELHVQVISKKAKDMEKEAGVIRERLGANTYVKIPMTPEGLKAIKSLSEAGVNVTATAIYTPMQAFLAAKAGAKYTAPYVNRINNMGYNGIQIAMDIHDIFRKNGLSAEVLAASFKNSQQVLELAKYGIGASTVATDVIEGFIKNAAITSAIQAFVDDFEGLVGNGRTMADC